MNRSDSAVPALKVRRVMPGAPKEIFDLWTDPALMAEWMSPYPGDVHCQATSDVRAGGTFSLVMRSPDSTCEISGTYVVVDPPRKLVMTWKGPPTGGAETLLTIELRPVGNDTELMLTHEKLPSAEIRTGHEGGWGNMLDHLEVLLH